MNEHQPDWMSQLSASPFTKSHFTDELKKKIQQKAANSKPYLFKPWTIPRLLLSVLAGVMIVYAALYVSGNWLKMENSAKTPGGLLFTIFPDPELAAGKPYGYMLHFNADFEQFAGKSLSIRAVHLKSGTVVDAMPEQLITEPSPGYDSLERFTVTFGLPLSGLWRYEVLLNGSLYGSMELEVNDSVWEVSPVFSSGIYKMRGIEKKLGFIDSGFIAGQSNKYMWHFWGADKALSGKLTIAAVRQGSDQLVEVFTAAELGDKLNGADRHVVTSMMLPTSGKWRLMAYIDEQLIDSIIVEVKPKA
ncbi:DUF4871 domain-containing protein [Paenibacillus eucommiae]|uniref:DUF4871 domain-containing protein n=1 Tax=Paenibacillus eucommiae TaxID=1355755 RepID=A0ABS4IR65_9BACL|nr:DUF4871 domain-containing protein [Paenibacillus eucommiae]MBP1990068.1 hypothetical protein [Paenibacillus eucommiae]